MKRLAALLDRGDDDEPILDQLKIAQATKREAEAEGAAARAAAGAPRVAPSREQVRASFGAFLNQLAELAPERGNALLRRALGDGGSWSRRRG